MQGRARCAGVSLPAGRLPVRPPPAHTHVVTGDRPPPADDHASADQSHGNGADVIRLDEIADDVPTASAQVGSAAHRDPGPLDRGFHDKR